MSIARGRLYPRPHRAQLALIVTMLLVGCSPAPRLPDSSSLPDLPPGFPLDYYTGEASGDGQVFVVDPQRSEIRVYAYRGGRLARLGHNHVIASRDVRGFILLGNRLEDSRADLYFPLLNVLVDDPGMRAEAGEGYASEPTDEDKTGTLANMLREEVLDAATYPFAQVSVDVIGGHLPVLQLKVRPTLRGVTSEAIVPAVAALRGDELTVRGAFELHQSRHGITPFSVLGGALRVEDRVGVVFRLVATPPPDPADRADALRNPSGKAIPRLRPILVQAGDYPRGMPGPPR